MEHTAEEFDLVAQQCISLFSKKTIDYGTAWRILRVSSLTDQIYIKAQRIRNIEQTGVKKVDEGIIPEFIGIVNYSAMALIQLEVGVAETMEELMPSDQAISLFTKYLNQAKMLMMDKNHDYGEAWRKMRISSLTDIILMKLLRIKQIEDNKGETLVSEGLDANYYDIINYAVFALIRLLIEKEEEI
ncbi:MAG TPA: DUF1599 domain-containing protein [Bacteroidales bacterium]|jgi:hypothetical protein|nr:DUF1599 domain-containing protein [Bacteroidales bacterium]HPY80358.1 DUF1599 domain-containing protein [Bacteroidales bacterium]HQA86294.1 DUF1599 domain-containing protein [Bacteroidales bacterium]HRR04235.1 DUF1599 domain-containing protein [Bacteroidales bacterium]HRT13557.1 DUF1599 domain-containing protein [Bacteroidales bacterium]